MKFIQLLMKIYDNFVNKIIIFNLSFIYYINCKVKIYLKIQSIYIIIKIILKI
jgi:hypothetical protein